MNWLIQNISLEKISSEIIEKIGSFIYSQAEKENSELLNLGDYGLKKMPELAFAYECGKGLFRLRELILNSSEYTWEREYTIEIEHASY